jgi:ABC-type transporter Mla subunit MlaD
VRAIFDDANYIISGEDVKIAGVKVGSVDSLEVTKDKKAAIVLNITTGGFRTSAPTRTARSGPSR